MIPAIWFAEAPLGPGFYGALRLLRRPGLIFAPLAIAGMSWPAIPSGFFGDRRFQEVVASCARRPAADLADTVLDEMSRWCGGSQ